MGIIDWIKLGRPENKAFNESTNELVVKMHERNKTWGIRQIRMQIKKIYGLIVTNFAVYRYMRLNDIQSITRKKTHRYSKTPHHEIPNLLQRNFTTFCSNCKWSIDISYIFAVDGVKYLCAIKDMYDKSIIAYTISRFIDLTLVMDTVKKAVENVPLRQRKNLILHSDQGWHFTHIEYQMFLKENDIIEFTSNNIGKFYAKVKEVNQIMPKYKAIRGMIISEEPLIKTTTGKIKRQANLDAMA